MPNKIYITGGLKSGKSFVGSKLSEKIGTSHFDLDKIVFISIGKEERDEKSRNKELDKILHQDKWIIEGTYVEDWVSPALKTADIIVWLDTPPRIKLYRFFKQIIKEKENRKNLYGRGRLVIGLKYKQYDRSRRAYRALLQPFQNKVVILKSKKDTEEFLRKT